MTSESIIALSNVAKRYGKTPVLRGVSLRVERGEFVGLAGVNGAGKTTLLKCLLDFSTPDSGTIELFGMGHRQPDSRSRLAFLPERFVPPNYLTGRDFLRYAATLRGMRWSDNTINAMLESLELEPAALSRPVRTFSKGMTQKLGLAAIFLAERELLVLDEPMSGLDPKARACVKRLLFAARDTGRTVFLTSHSLADIDEICDSVVVLHQGVPYFAGAPRDLCQDFGTRSLEQAFLLCIEGVHHDRTDQTISTDRR